ncbi:MetQ/NlpA family ABC transporter substrate-binding protein [Clostridium thermarum]|uniref:MetQ/NlpA family ABC transporter substrate-binding protein n=1 Tax=Clostridium thermarum TaxID=1716543 RepID=UPI0013D0DC92|nr:MetQ/NlpA family ABC transporter substrate-binding protein [Clostridium thermarum]
MKKILSLVTAAVLLLSFGGCTKKNTTAGDTTNKNEVSSGTETGKSDDKKEIIVGATPVPHKEILEIVKPILEKEGYTLTIKEFTDYVLPNTELNEGSLDANFFQHVPYLEATNAEKGTDLTYTVKVHLEPMGLYSKKIKSLDELKDGATISIPNDSTNGARALRLLEKNGIIKLKDGELVTKLDIIENPKNIKIEELEAPMLPTTLADVDASIINSNFAMENGLNPTTDSIVIEDKESPYANVLAVKRGNEDKPYIQALSKALTSEEVKKFIEEKYEGAIVPSF